jgi:hypothetical protein
MSTARAMMSRFRRSISPFRPTSSCADVTLRVAKRLFGLRHRCARELTHAFDRVEDVVVGRLVARQPHEFGDVRALVAHPLDAADDVQQSRDDPHISRDRRLAREQPHRTLVYLHVAPVDPVVVGDDRCGQLNILEADRLERAVQLLRGHVQTAKRVLLELLERFSELVACFLHLAPRHGERPSPRLSAFRREPS